MYIKISHIVPGPFEPGSGNQEKDPFKKLMQMIEKALKKLERDIGNDIDRILDKHFPALDLKMILERIENSIDLNVNIEQMIKLEKELTIDLIEGKLSHIDEVKPEWYNIDYSPAIYKGHKVYYWQGIKIRSILSGNLKSKGYPVMSFRKISFDSGISLWVPSTCDIDFFGTANRWKENRSDRWRNVNLMYVGSNKLRAILNLIPVFNAEALLQTIMRELYISINVWDFMAFYNTAHDKLIIANWDKVKAQIESF